jgi:two-component system response regulator FixJ
MVRLAVYLQLPHPGLEEPSLMKAPETDLGPLILVVDDDQAMRASLTFSLKAEGFRVLAYSVATELLADPGSRAGDCLVIDYRLPGMNGLDLLTELRRRRMAQPALIITTQPQRAVSERARLMGATIIEKPLLTEALFEEIRRTLPGNS